MTWRETLDAALGHVVPIANTAFTRQHLKEISAQQQETLVEHGTKVFAKQVRDTARQTAVAVSNDKTVLNPELAASQAETIIINAFPDEDARLSLEKAGYDALVPAFSVGARSESEMMKASRSGKSTTAEEITQRLAIDVTEFGLDPLGLGKLPEWILAEANAVLAETFAQSYWQKINTTTRNDIQKTLADAIELGWSTRRVAEEIMAKHGADYSLARGTMVARTELGNMLNAGHDSQIRKLSEESGLVIAKEWLSVKGNTTRPEHAALDGAISDKDGMFELGGVKVPWPSHMSLPAAMRVNCQCTILSTLSAEMFG